MALHNFGFLHIVLWSHAIWLLAMRRCYVLFVFLWHCVGLDRDDWHATMKLAYPTLEYWVFFTKGFPIRWIGRLFEVYIAEPFIYSITCGCCMYILLCKFLVFLVLLSTSVETTCWAANYVKDQHIFIEDNVCVLP